LEQAYINFHRKELSNKINSISPNKPWYEDAVKWGEGMLDRFGF